MKSNYRLFIILFLVVIFHNNILVVINNISRVFISNNSNILNAALKEENERLKKEYNSLLDFKNNININKDYTVTNAYFNNYKMDKIILNGNYKVGSEVINEDGLVGIVSSNESIISKADFIYETSIIVRINDSIGKIIDSDKDNNLLIGEISNYDKININDIVTSNMGSFIGKVIDINDDEYQKIITVSSFKLEKATYVAVIESV